MNASMYEQFRTARSCSTPIIAIKTVDARFTINAIAGGLTAPTPLVEWDSIRGVTAANDLGQKAVALFCSEEPSNYTKLQPVLADLPNAPEGTILFAHNASAYLTEPSVQQGIWNLRDQFKDPRRTLVLLSPDFSWPAMLSQDIHVIDEALPDDAQRLAIVKAVLEGADLALTQEEQERASQAMRGLSANTCEQVLAISMASGPTDENGKPLALDMDVLWARNKEMVEQTDGIKVHMGGETLADVGGLQGIKDFFANMAEGEDPPCLVVMIDEIEKAMGGQVDSEGSGTTKDQLGVLLTQMQDNEWGGMILAGPPGTAKSLLSKSLASTLGCKCVVLDLGGAKSKYVGESETKIRAIMKMVFNIAGKGRAYFIATSNGIKDVKPELKRRFWDDVWFVDLPSAEEREAIWTIKLRQFGLDPSQPLPDAEGWSGAEIKKCCRRAKQWRKSVLDAAATIIPLALSQPEVVEDLRKSADGRWPSATTGLAYSRPGVSGGNVGARKFTRE